MNLIALQIDFSGTITIGKTPEQFIAEIPNFTALLNRELNMSNYEVDVTITPVSPFGHHQLLSANDWCDSAGESNDATTALQTLRMLAQLEVLNADLHIAGMNPEKSLEWLVG